MILQVCFTCCTKHKSLMFVRIFILKKSGICAWAASSLSLQHHGASLLAGFGFRHQYSFRDLRVYTYMIDIEYVLHVYQILYIINMNIGYWIFNILDVWWAKPVWDSADQPDDVLSTIRCFQHYSIQHFITYDLIISTIRPMWALSILQVIIIHHDDQSDDDDEHVVCVMCNKFHFMFQILPFLLNIYHIFPFIFQQSHHCPLGWLHVGRQRDALEPLDRHLHLRFWRDSSKF